MKEVTERRGADVIYDPVGGDVFDLSMKCIASEGRLLVVGFAGGRIPNIQANRVLLKNMAVVGVFWGDYANSRPWYIRETQNALEQLYAAGKICPAVTCTYKLSEAPKAMHDIAARRSYRESNSDGGVMNETIDCRTRGGDDSCPATRPRAKRTRP